MAVASYSAQLIINEVISPTTRRLVLERTDQGLINFTPGQFVSLAFPYQDNTYRRSYSIATLTQEPQTNQQLEIVIAQVPGGKATRYFFEQAAIGDQLEVFGPYGVLVLPKADWPKRVVLMATGTGVAPYRTMLPLLREQLEQTALQVDLVFGVRSPAELLYGDDFTQLARQCANFRFHTCYSRTLPDNPGPRDYQGYVQTQLANLAPDPAQDMFYLCGNPAMIDEVFQGLKELNFTGRQVKREKYVFAKN
jgi:ferredoxin-NADP reductase